MQQTAEVDPALVQACAAEYTQLNTEAARLAQKTAAMLGRYQRQGVNVRSIKRAHKAGRSDAAAASAQLRTDVRYQIILGILKPADDEWTRAVVQSEMFADLAETPRVDPRLSKARAQSDGYNTGRHGGEGAENPHPPGTAEHLAWNQGHRDGVADRALKPAKPRVADATPRRPVGRPKLVDEADLQDEPAAGHA
jgi:hypothetical protein